MNRQMEFHYINTGFPYAVTESFLNFFDGLTYNLSDFSFPSVMPDQEGPYWSMPTVSNKFGISGVGNISYHEYSHAHELNNHVMRAVEERRALDNSSMMNHEDWEVPNIQSGGSSSRNTRTVPEESFFLNPMYQYKYDASITPELQLALNSVIARLVPDGEKQSAALNELKYFRNAIGSFGTAAATSGRKITHPGIQSDSNGSNSQVIWQDNIDPDNMTYEELLDLGEAVGTQNRGLSQELISSLPISKYKYGSFFSRKKSRERCVICQMEYKRRDRQMTLPCKHVYHASCGSRWLSINKACPVCYTEVFGEDPRR